MNETVLEILNLCLTLKEKGYDAFFDYAAHINCIRVYVYDGNWSEDKSRLIDYGMVGVGDVEKLNKIKSSLGEIANEN